MTRYEVLRTVLMGQTVSPATPKEQNALVWAQNHAPLLSPSTFSASGRHINRFCVGSDPEFCFADILGRDTKAEAYGCGLRVGLAAGCDQNERLIELRPWPSVSVVEHVAGILTALRWMFRVYNQHALTLAWRAGAFFAGDGIGGHVHFGRKRPTRPEEVAALDGLARVLKLTGLFPIKEWSIRMKGDRLHQLYGLPGDFRVQKHGYEYRSLPSWLQSPEVAFTALTSSKLAVLDPAVTTSWTEKHTPEGARNLLRGLAKLYKGRDDDSYILYHILTRAGDDVFKVAHGADFAPAWGFRRDVLPTDKDADVILPASIPPHPTEIEEIRNHLLVGVGMTYQELPPTFVTSLPRGMGYKWVPQHTTTGRHPGFGDLIHNLVTHRDMSIQWTYGSNDQFAIDGTLPKHWTKHDTVLLRKYYPGIRIRPTDDARGTVLIVPKCLCQTGTISGLRAILLRSGLFPIWTVDGVKRDSCAKWLETHPEIKTSSPMIWRNC